MRSENERDIPEEDLPFYHSHPQRGAELVGNIDGVDPVVPQAILQHHERRDRSGFPHKIGVGMLNRIAEVIGVVDDFLHVLKRAEQDKTLHPFKEMKAHYFNGYSADIITAFQDIFMVRKPTVKAQRHKRGRNAA